jgi:AhpD family alkylhydroperoxidase
MAERSAAATNPGKASAPARARKGRKARPTLSVVAGGSPAEPAADASPKNAPSAPPKHHRKPKRTLTPANIVKTVVNVAASGRVLARAFIKPATSAALREKVVLGVTSVNDCRYCAWGHTHWAMAHGVSLEEVNQILGHQTAELAAKDPAEAAAILFAQHYAEHHDQFDPQAIDNLRQYYSEAQIDEIIAYVRAITLGNLTGNTVDAFLGRFRSHGHTSIFFEGAIAAAVAPIFVAVMMVSKFDRRVGLREMRLPKPA